MFSLDSNDPFKKTEKFLEDLQKINVIDILHRYGRLGVDSLAEATPTDTGLTASSWVYDLVQDRSGYSILWNNTNTKDGVNVAVILQYGHGTGTGGWVEGHDYVNPAIRPIFEGMADEIDKEVKNVGR